MPNADKSERGLKTTHLYGHHLWMANNELRRKLREYAVSAPTPSIQTYCMLLKLKF